MMSYWATRRSWSLAVLYMNQNFWYIKKDRKIIKLILIFSWSGLRLKERASEKGVWKLRWIFLSDYTAWDAFDWLTVEKSLRHNAFTNSGKNIDYSLAIYSILGIPLEKPLENVILAFSFFSAFLPEMFFRFVPGFNFSSQGRETDLEIYRIQTSLSEY